MDALADRQGIVAASQVGLDPLDDDAEKCVADELSIDCAGD